MKGEEYPHITIGLSLSMTSLWKGKGTIINERKRGLWEWIPIDNIIYPIVIVRQYYIT